MASEDYFTLTDFEVYRGVAPSATTSPNEDQVQKYIDLAVLRFEKEVGVYRQQTGVSEQMFGDAKGIFTKNVPITSITSIHESNGDVITPTWTEIDSNDYRIYKADIGRVWLRFPYSLKREYKIVYDCGYSPDEMPENVKSIIYYMTMDSIFKFHLFDNNIGSNVTKIVDVDVYREVTKGGDPFAGFGAMTKIINDEKVTLKGALRTFIKW